MIRPGFVIFAALLLTRLIAYPQATSASLDPTLTRDLFLIESFKRDPSRENTLRMKSFGLPAAADPALRVFLHTPQPLNEQSMQELKALDVRLFSFTYLPPVGFHKTGFVLAESPASQIRWILKTGFVCRITAAYRRLTPQNDLTAEETGATRAWRQDPPIRGDGVRLAIIDSGFQLAHPDLPEPAAAMDYADYPDTSADVYDHYSGHGTHVAGTAYGSGELSGGRWRGMAPDAEPIYLKIGDDSTSNASTAAVVGAIRGAATWCEADILSMSYGGFDGFNDGTSAEEQAVDWAVSQGVTAFMSAGNNAKEENHYYGTVESLNVKDSIQIVAKLSPENTYWQLVLAYFDSPDTSVHDELDLQIYDGDGELLAYDQLDRVSSPRGTEAVIYLPRDPLPRDSTSFFVVVENWSLRDHDFHLYTVSSHYYVRFPEAHRGFIISLPSTADSCISVAAYTSRTSWTNWQGIFQDDRTTRGEIANFSSIGPRIDGALKPNIAAPGRRTISCRNTDRVRIDGVIAYLVMSNNGETGEPADYVALMGTSMSSPAAAGTAALILQADPDLSPSELRERIYRSAGVDEFTGNVPNTTWGWGKIDVMRALEAPNDPGFAAALPASLALTALYPNPFNEYFQFEIAAREGGWFEYSLFDLNGRRVNRGSYHVESAGRYRFVSKDWTRGLPAGMYWLGIRSGEDFQATPVHLMK